MFDTVEDLANAVTGALGSDGPLGTLAQTLTDTLDGVWAEFFGAATPPGGTNWNAYSHEQLYEMLWQDADVGDVGTVAAEWGRHSAALTEFADALRGEAAALPSNWQGRAAELAVDRLAELSDKIWNVGARAGTIQKAASDAGDALAHARNTMPPPLPDPMTLMTSAVGVGPLPPLQAVMVGGARLFTADAVAGASKAEAVRVMQRYESSLRDSGRRVVPAESGATASRTFQADGLEGGTTSAAGASGERPSMGRCGTGGVPWARLAGGVRPGPGGLVGAGPLGVQNVLAAERAVLAAAAQRAGPTGFLGSGAAGRPAGGEQDKSHRRQLPNVDDNIFSVDQRASVPVIGDGPDGGHHDGL